MTSWQLKRKIHARWCWKAPLSLASLNQKASGLSLPLRDLEIESYENVVSIS